MSWTIQTTAQDNEDMKLLKDAITKAASANILMFCSTSDQGGNTNESCYPGDWGQCIRIGGATFTGDKLTWVDDKVDFWFPGRDVPFHLADAESVTYESGSSVATAAASGLAGALIYCARLVKGNDKAYFQDRDLLQKAFEKMATGKDGKFPRTDAIFREMFTNKLRQRDPTLRKSLNIAMLAWDDVSKQALSDLLLHIQVRDGCKKEGVINYGWLTRLFTNMIKSGQMIAVQIEKGDLEIIKGLFYLFFVNYFPIISYMCFCNTLIST